MDLDDQITVRVGSDLTDDIESLSKSRDERKSQTIREALRRGIDEVRGENADA